ncbi:MAG: hypothetical protein C4542_09115 [Dehalococcoidia bacterium]|nr:MAG: hypothetical protein C4542_09115 [Dehalococcoidia bacterium]
METSDLEFATKCLVPKKGEHVIVRRRLIDLLHRKIDKRVQTLSAPAGYGKTTLLIDFAGELEAPVCWYSLDASDQDASLLIEGIVHSIRRSFPEFGQATLGRLAASRDATQEIRALAGTLSGEMYETIPDFFVLVLDDYHSVEDSPAAREMLNLLIERAPENCHIVMASRTPVNLPALHKLKLQEAASSLATADLAFAPAEIKDLLGKHHGLNLTEQEAGTLAEGTEGWIVGILLSSYSLRSGKPSEEVFSLSHEDVFRYLGAEVYLKQTPEVREFLLGSSTLESMNPASCDALLQQKGSHALLKDIEKRSLFIQCIDDKKSCFRYHALFREFLQKTLLVENRELFTSLHSQAALSAEKDCRWQDAIGHYLTAGLYTQAQLLIARVGQEYLKSGKWSTVAKWIEALPENARADDHDLVLLYAQSLIHLGENGRAARFLTKALSQTSDDADWLFRSMAFSWRSAALRITGHFTEARNDIEQAIALLNSHNGSPDALGDAYRRLGTISAEQGEFQIALNQFNRALELFSSLLDVGQMADVHNSIGVLHKRLGQLNQAFTHFERAREGWLETKNYGALAVTLVNVGYAYQRFGQYSLALDTMEAGIEKARMTGYRRAEACLLIGKAEILRDFDRYDEALDSYNQSLDIAREVMESYYVICAKAGLGETYRLLGDTDKAEVLLKEAVSQADSQGQGYESALFTTQLGVIEYERGHYAEANSILKGVCLKLETIGDKDGLAKACFHLAQAAFLEKKYADAVSYLKRASSLADELDYGAFLAIEGRKAVLLMEYAVAEGISVERFTRTVEKIKLHRLEIDRLSRAGSHAGAPRKPEIEARALGESGVSLDGQPISEPQWRSVRAKEILFFLLSSDGAQTRENITAAVWPDLSPAKAASNFHINLYRLRRALHPRIITMEQGRYLINPNLEIWFDALEFEKLVKASDNAGLSDAELVPNLENALSLYKGQFLTDIYSDWAAEKRQELENGYVKALMLLARLSSNRGQHYRAVGLLEKLLTIEPYQDEIYCHLIEEHLAMGNDLAASGLYKRYVETVAREMDCVPSARMRGLYKRILTGGVNNN